MTYRSVLGRFRTTTLESHVVTLMLETLRGDETLDTRSFGIWFLPLALRLNLTANDEAADLSQTNQHCSPVQLMETSPW